MTRHWILRTAAMVFGIACLTLLGACATLMHTSLDGATFIVVRHAEKSTDDPRDPDLSDVGKRRADLLAERLRGENLTAAYATQYRRTRQTAAPVADAHGIALMPYDAGESAAAFATRLRAAHRSGTVLVVGHSNTVPAIMAALCDCAVADIDDDDYGNLYRIQLDGQAPLRLQHSRY